MIHIVYQPRADDPIVVAKFKSYDDAKSHMEVIKKERPKAYAHHKIHIVNDVADEWLWQDSGIEVGF